MRKKDKHPLSLTHTVKCQMSEKVRLQPKHTYTHPTHTHHNKAFVYKGHGVVKRFLKVSRRVLSQQMKELPSCSAKGRLPSEQRRITHIWTAALPGKPTFPGWCRDAVAAVTFSHTSRWPHSTRQRARPRKDVDSWGRRVTAGGLRWEEQQEAKSQC